MPAALRFCGLALRVLPQKTQLKTNAFYPVQNTQNNKTVVTVTVTLTGSKTSEKNLLLHSLKVEMLLFKGIKVLGCHTQLTELSVAALGARWVPALCLSPAMLTSQVFRKNAQLCHRLLHFYCCPTVLRNPDAGAGTQLMPLNVLTD